MSRVFVFCGPGGRYEVTLPADRITLQDRNLLVVANGVVSAWPVEIDETDAQGIREISGFTGDGTNLWFVLSVRTTSEISYWGDGKIIRTDLEVN